MSRTEKLRRLAKRLKIEKNHLYALADDLREANFPMCAEDISRYAACCMTLGISMEFFADGARRAKSAQQQPPESK